MPSLPLTARRLTQIHRFAILALAFGLAAGALGGPVPAAEKLLPGDTLFMVTAPDFKSLAQNLTNLPQYRLWQDPSMTPFREKFLTNAREGLIQPFERQLGVSLGQIASYAQGQVTLALLPEKDRMLQNWMLLVDTQDKAGMLRTNLADLRAKWTSANKPLRTEKLRETEFMVFTVSTNDLPRGLLDLLPKKLPYQELGKETPAPVTEREVTIGLADSVLIVSSSTKGAEAVVNALAAVEVPRLAEQTDFASVPATVFRDASVRGWVNVKAFVDALIQQAAAEVPNPEAPKPVEEIPTEKALAALGLTGVKYLAFGLRATPEGTSIEAFVAAPESTRTGLVKIISGDPKETTPPPFVPADAVSFSRRRIDGQKAWATLEKTVNDISPQWLNILNFVLDTANAAAKEKTPGFDVRRSLIGNLGDDFITYTKVLPAPEPGKPADTARIVLVGSPHPDELANSLKNVLVFVTAQSGPPSEREFLGRKIYTVQIPALPNPVNPGAPNTGPQKLHYVASGSYVAFSASQPLLEEHLRSTDTQAKTLRELQGLPDATQKVTNPATTALTYDNDLEQTREEYQSLRASGSTNGLASVVLPGMLPVQAANLNKYLDVSLLPPFEQIAKYFYLSVSSISASVDGLTYKQFTPTPPGAK